MAEVTRKQQDSSAIDWRCGGLCRPCQGGIDNCDTFYSVGGIVGSQKESQNLVSGHDRAHYWVLFVDFPLDDQELADNGDCTD